MDVSLLSSFSQALDNPEQTVTILEIGAGFGRLAEALLNVFPGKLRYIILDAVPGSLMYSYLYLKEAFPELAIGAHFLGDSDNSDKFSVYIAPAWHCPKIDGKIDISINIESFQEMSPAHVHHYLELIDRATKSEGLVYLSNARNYVNKTGCQYPARWRKLYVGNTPRSWSENHPTEIFTVTPSENNWTTQNMALEGAHCFSVDTLKNNTSKPIKSEVIQNIDSSNELPTLAMRLLRFFSRHR